MKTTTFRTLIIGAVVTLGLLAVACGGDDAGTSAGGGGGEPPAFDQVGRSTDAFATANPASRDAAALKGTTTESRAAGDSSIAASPQQAPSGAGEAPALASTLDRKIIFNATIDLSVKDVPTAYNAVSRAARGAGGFVEKSSFLNAAGDDGPRSATLTLRVPVLKYEDVLGELRTMDGVKVQREGSKSSEVTEQYTDLQSRLRNLQSTEVQYLKLLEQAKTINEILTVNDRVNSVRSQIEQIQGRLKVFDSLTEMATIDVSIAPIVPLKAGKQDGPKSIGEAFADAWAASLEAVRYVSAAGAVVAVALIWLAIPAALVLLAARHARRNRPGAVAS